jgi:hypothetical protein
VLVQTILPKRLWFAKTANLKQTCHPASLLGRSGYMSEAQILLFTRTLRLTLVVMAFLQVHLHIDLEGFAFEIEQAGLVGLDQRSVQMCGDFLRYQGHRND